MIIVKSNITSGIMLKNKDSILCFHFVLPQILETHLKVFDGFGKVTCFHASFSQIFMKKRTEHINLVEILACKILVCFELFNHFLNSQQIRDVLEYDVVDFKLDISKPHFRFQIQNRSLETWIFEHLNGIQIFFLSLFEYFLVFLFNNSSIKQYLGSLRTFFKNFISDLECIMQILKGFFGFFRLWFWSDRYAEHVVNVSNVQMHFSVLFYFIRKGKSASSFNLFIAAHHKACFGWHYSKRRVGFD